jgi:hypothetical protein
VLPPGVQTYCTSKQSSVGCWPSISASGAPSSSAAQGFEVRALEVRNLKAGLLLYGLNGRMAAPFSGGFLCVAPQVRRTPGQSAGGHAPPANDCSGTFSIDMNAFAAGTWNPPGSPHPALHVPGTQVNCQWWGRDQGFPAPNNTTLSDGLEYVVGPCSALRGELRRASPIRGE